MEDSCNKLVMAVLMAVLAIKGTSAVIVIQTNAQQPSTKNVGLCPTYTPLTSFTKTGFDGIWFVYQQAPNLIETGWTCKKLTYDEATNAFTYSFKSSGVATSYVGTYTVPNTSSGAISVALQYMLALGADSFGRVNQFVVAGVATDYMIVKSCTNFGLFHTEYVYVLTRDQVPTATTSTALAAALGTAGINSGTLQTVVQTGC